MLSLLNHDGNTHLNHLHTPAVCVCVDAPVTVKYYNLHLPRVYFGMGPFMECSVPAF